MEDMASCWMSQIDFLDSLSTWFSNGIILKISTQRSIGNVPHGKSG